jgi:hypothetical protein
MPLYVWTGSLRHNRIGGVSAKLCLPSLVSKCVIGQKPLSNCRPPYLQKKFENISCFEASDALNSQHIKLS